MLETLPRGGEGWRAVRTGSSMVIDTPDFCWLIERRMRLSLGITGIERETTVNTAFLLLQWCRGGWARVSGTKKRQTQRRPQSTLFPQGDHHYSIKIPFYRNRNQALPVTFATKRQHNFNVICLSIQNMYWHTRLFFCFFKVNVCQLNVLSV